MCHIYVLTVHIFLVLMRGRILYYCSRALYTESVFITLLLSKWLERKQFELVYVHTIIISTLLIGATENNIYIYIYIIIK